jgi:hypothetical protein
MAGTSLRRALCRRVLPQNRDPFRQLAVRHALPGRPAPHELPAARSPSAIGSPLRTCAPDANPFRTYAVAESAGMHGHKGERPFRAPLPDCACETNSAPSGANQPIPDGKPTFQSESGPEITTILPAAERRGRIAVGFMADEILANHIGQAPILRQRVLLLCPPPASKGCPGLC